ncbi:carbon starvation CstA family protein [Romboutsia sp. Marseille-P6047]|uniref:carbon starvation CstA family protein n=1 Tax=Romboutsia sp. Marseille-P6047 TaxID=2161817 RepID=UPI000822A80B|nr:carbon starvation protein A [Romboutsia sp. Marseille-P6047]SCG98924.1 Carbon starvation protein A [uncultured Clostridium sp.]
MNALFILFLGIIVLFVGYVTYGRWLAKQWGIDEKRTTPSHELEDGIDYVPAKTPVLLGHHFSSIAGAGPINGPIQAAVFGWVPVVLWVLIGGIFFGATHDFGALFASIRHKGQSIGEVIGQNIGPRAKKLFLTFSYLTLILVVAAFASIVADTFKATFTQSGAVDYVASSANASTAMISLLFILLAIAFGFLVYRRNASLGVSTVIGIVAIIICIALGLNFHPIYLSSNTWMIIVGIYILIASVTPVWILLQPRDYLSSFLLYGMIAIAIVGIIGCHPTLDIPAFTGFTDTIAPTGTSLGYLFPALFITIACGAISGFHSLVASGTTAKQLDKEADARPIAYGSMLIECALALISVCAVGYIWKDYSTGTTVTPTVVFASGIASMLSKIPGLSNVYNIAYSLLVLTVSVFCLTSLDTATRLARYMFQEFWLAPGETRDDVSGFKKTITNPYVATLITVVLGISLGLTGYANIWALFGAANQLLAALGLLAIATWLGNIGRNNKMFFIPMVFMLVVTVTSLVLTIKSNVLAIMSGGTGLGWCYIRTILALLLVILAIILMIEGFNTIKKQFKSKTKQA